MANFVTEYCEHVQWRDREKNQFRNSYRNNRTVNDFKEKTITRTLRAKYKWRNTQRSRFCRGCAWGNETNKRFQRFGWIMRRTGRRKAIPKEPIQNFVSDNLLGRVNLRIYKIALPCPENDERKKEFNSQTKLSILPVKTAQTFETDAWTCKNKILNWSIKTWMGNVNRRQPTYVFSECLAIDEDKKSRTETTSEAFKVAF